MAHYGIRGVALSFCESFLKDRVQVVSWKGKTSNPRKVYNGVPQGSILGPILYLLYVNDMRFAVNESNEVSLQQYADDTSVLCHGGDKKETEKNMEQAQRGLEVWFQLNQLKLNTAKNQDMLFQLKGNEGISSEGKLLGLHLDGRLTWLKNTEALCKSLSSINYLLLRLRDVVAEDTLRQAYMAMFQGKLAFGICFWGDSNNAKKVLIVQKRCIRIMSRARTKDSCRPLFEKWSLLTVPALYILEALKWIKQREPGIPKTKDIHSHDTRGKENIYTELCRKEKTRRSLENTAKRLFNKLPVTIRNCTYTLFVNSVKRILLAHPVYSVDEFLGLEL